MLLPVPNGYAARRHSRRGVPAPVDTVSLDAAYTGTFDEVFLTPPFFADPYPYYHQLRKEAPVYWSERLQAWLLTSYQDVRSALGDRRLSSGGRIESIIARLPAETHDRFEPLRRHMSSMMAFSDPPDHTRLRRLVSKAFAPRTVARLQPKIENIVDGLLDRVVGKPRCDLVHEFAFQLPSLVICEMLGIPERDQDKVKRWSDDVIGFVSAGSVTVAATQRAQDSVFEASRYLLELADSRRRRPRDDLMTALVVAEDDGESLTRDELVSMCVLLFYAGFETTEGLIGNGLHAMMRNPDQMAALRADPGLVDSAVEEFLRYDSSVQRQSRVANQDFEIRGVPIREGDYVAMLLGAANRDPAQFSNPDALDIARRPNPHVAFGHGIHTCLGAPLARLEARVAIRQLLARIRHIRLATDTVEWTQLLAIRKLNSLPVSID